MKVSNGPENMETGLCCVYNATRGCRLNSRLTVADSVHEPLKVLKVLIEGLARDGESSLWLTPLAFTPNIMRLFPFDFAYLDDDLKVIEALPLPPGVPLPQFNSQVASALILPFDSFSSSGTCAGDRLIICTEADLEARIAEIAASSDVVPDPVLPDAPVAQETLILSPAAKPAQSPDRVRQVSPPSFSAAQGTRSTLAMTTSWQISTSTMAAMLPDPTLPEHVELQEREAACAKLEVPEIAVEHPEIAGVSERIDATVLAGSEPKEEVSAPAPSPAIDQPMLGAREQDEKPKIEVAGTTLETAPVVVQAKVQVDSPEIRTDTLVSPRRKPAEVVPATIAPAAAAELAKTTKASGEKKKESLGVLVKRFLNCEDPLPERRSIIRLISKELVAYTADTEKEAHEVRDVSPTGLYLRSQEKWQPGQIASLTLQRKGIREEDHERRVCVRVKTVRSDEGGIGVSWVWPEGVEFQPWKRVHTKRSDETDADFFLRELRLTGALGFLRQICPSALEEIKLALHQRLSNKRVASAVEITLKAQELMAVTEADANPLAHPDMVRRILEIGSWTVDDWIRVWWAGLLVSSCSADGLDTSNSVFIDILAKLTPAHLRVLKFVCDRNPGSLVDGASKPTSSCTADQLIEVVGSQSLSRIQQTMGQLSSLGLLADSSKPSYVALTDKGKTKIEPTDLAMKMYARCNGRQC